MDEKKAQFADVRPLQDSCVQALGAIITPFQKEIKLKKPP
jgi:hypothetical protein